MNSKRYLYTSLYEVLIEMGHRPPFNWAVAEESVLLVATLLQFCLPLTYTAYLVLSLPGLQHCSEVTWDMHHLYEVSKVTVIQTLGEEHWT